MRKTIAVSLGAAFGLVIALLWNTVVQGALQIAGIQFNPVEGWNCLFVYVGVVVAVSVLMIILIIVVSRWSSKS